MGTFLPTDVPPRRFNSEIIRVVLANDTCTAVVLHLVVAVGSCLILPFDIRLNNLMRSEFTRLQSLQQTGKVEVGDCLDFRLILQTRTVIHIVYARDSMLNVDEVWS